MSNATLKPLVQPGEIRDAFESVANRMKHGVEGVESRIGYPSGDDGGTVYWHDRFKFWALFNPNLNKNRYYSCFGTENPADHPALSITVEFNPPHEGVNRTLGGVFVRDDAGHVYMAHSGKVGGGRRGIGKETFWGSYGRDNAETVTWPDGQTSPVVVISDIGGPRLIERVVDFVRVVAEFKESAVSGKKRVARGDQHPEVFNPEFEGKRHPYTPSGDVEAHCDHGTVVRRLRDRLRGAGHKVGNWRTSVGQPDLYIAKHGHATHLFEVKMDISTSSVFQGVGQLMLHGAAMKRALKRILVLPDQPKNLTQEALNSLGIAVLVFDWNDGKPLFADLNDVL